MTTPARVVAWLRGLLGFSNDHSPDNSSRPRPPAPPHWLDVPVRELTADELRADPHRPRIVRVRWLDRAGKDPR